MLSSVSVIAPARLHMGFLDLSGALKRHFGSIGVALDEPLTHLTITKNALPTPLISITDEQRALSKRAEKYLDIFCNIFNIQDQLDISVTSAIPEHIGLGSGTQMALAVGSGLNALYQLNLSTRDIAAKMERGLRSGIGIGIFENGGLVVDGGRGENTITPPLLARFNMPPSWRFILIFDERGKGLHGQQEIQAFKGLPSFPQREAERLSYLLLMQALPAIAEEDLKQFGAVITELQRVVGEHFSPVQGGIFASPHVAQATQWLSERDAVAIGQTSWGPTGFCLVDDADHALSLSQSAAQVFSHTPLKFKVIKARNSGGEINLF